LLANEFNPVAFIERTNREFLIEICFLWLLINLQLQLSSSSAGSISLPYVELCSHETVHEADLGSHCLLNDDEFERVFVSYWNL
jgi:hypothetical protein